MSHDRTVRPRDARTLIQRAMDVSRPVFLWGPPGIGKSDIIAELGKLSNRQVIDMRLLLMDPTDIKGMPFYNPETKEMEWAKPGDLPPIVSKETVEMERVKLAKLEEKLAKLETAFANSSYNEVELDAESLTALARYEELHDAISEKLRLQDAFTKRTEHALKFQTAILFLDEMNAAPPSVMAAGYQLILNRRVGQYELPKGVSIIAAGNRDTDKGVTYRMPSPLANRFTHLELEAYFEDWQKWAVNNDVHADVVGFLSHHKQHLFDFKPKSSDKAFATPRSWVAVSDLLTDSLDDHLNTTMVAGTVGEGFAIEFSQHRRVSAKMPKPNDILTGRVTDLKVNETSAMFSLAISMCYTLKEWLQRVKDESDKKYTTAEWHEAVDYFFAYIMDNFKTEMIILAAKTALREYELPIDHRKLKNFKKFHADFGSYILDD